MGAKLYVGNLNFKTTEEALRDAFSANGRTVKSVLMPSDRETGRPRGLDRKSTRLNSSHSVTSRMPSSA